MPVSLRGFGGYPETIQRTIRLRGIQDGPLDLGAAKVYSPER